MSYQRMISKDEHENQLDIIASQLNLQIKLCSEINQHRENFLQNNEDPKKTRQIRDVIAESWVRSKSTGISPDLPLTDKIVLKQTLFDKVLKDNKILMQSAFPILQEILPSLNKTRPVSVGLLDRNGINLFLRNFPLEIVNRSGLNLSEEMVGTSAHSICLNSGKPSFVLSPEVYNKVLQISKVVVAIPIHDSKENVIAAFVAPYFGELPQLEVEKNLFFWLISWQFSLVQRIEEAFAQATRKLIIQADNSNLNQKNNKLEAIYTFEDIIGKSSEIAKAKQLSQKIARIPGNTLIIGESGTGKELFAHAMHNEYNPDGPFVAVNCASIPKGLIESELFGYEGGSFTGAERKGRIGKLEMADGGTIFLDEIGDMPLELQPVFLRVLEDQRIMRVGGGKYIRVNFKVIAATNKNLYEKVQKNEFREDLYFRLAAFKILIPPLRERKTDIIDLARYFAQKDCAKLNISMLEIEEAVCLKLMNYDWPGNIRELKNCMAWSVNMAKGKISLKDLPDEIANHVAPVSDIALSSPQSLPALEKKALLNTLAHCNNNISAASKILGLTRPTLYKKLKDYGIIINK